MNAIKDKYLDRDILFEVNPNPMWIYDTESLKFLAVNNAAVNIYGYSREEFYNMTLKDIRPVEEVEKLVENIKNEKGAFQKSGNWRHLKKGGSTIYVEINSHELIYEGKSARLVLARDVTEQQKTLNALKISEEKYREFFDKVAVGLAEVSIDRTILKLNKRMSEIVGYNEKELRGKKFTDITHPDDADIGYSYFQKLLNDEGNYFTYEKRYITKDGRIIWAKLNSARLSNSDNENPRFLTVIEDITDKKNAEEKLQLYLNRYQTLITATSQIVWNADFNGKITTAQPSWQGYTGQSISEILGDGWLNAVHPDDYGKTIEAFKNAIKFKSKYEIEHRLRNKKGHYNHFITRGVPVIDTGNGNIIEWVGTCTDIDERKKAEEQKSRLAAIVESSEDAIIGMNLDLVITSWNKGAEKIFGYSQEEAVGEWYDFFHLSGTEDYNLIDFKSLIKRQNLLPYESIRKHKNGNLIPVLVTISHIKNSEGNLIGYSKIVRDITQQKKAREEIELLLKKEREARIKAEKNHKRLTLLTEAGTILNSSLNYKRTLSSLAKVLIPELATWFAVERLDEKDKLQRVAVEHSDPSKVKLAFEIADRFSAESGTEKGPNKIIRTKETEVYENISDNMLREASINDEYYNKLKLLEIRSAILAPLISRNKILGVITLVNDKPLDKNSLLDKNLAEAVARRVALAIDNSTLYEEVQSVNRELEGRVAKRTAQLSEANRELETFSYSVSHDLRAPLRAIHGYAGFLLEDYSNKLDEEGKRFINVIRDNSINMGNLIDELLAFSRMNKSAMNHSELNMKMMAQIICDELTKFEKDRKFEVKIDELPYIRGDNALIKQVWQNLISNALKYTARVDVAKIHIGFTEGRDEVTYFIKDNGVGFDMKYVDKLFGVFQRLHKATDFPGNGVGLALVKRIILRHKGNVKAEGEPGKGATFYFSLPKEVDKNG